MITQESTSRLWTTESQKLYIIIMSWSEVHTDYNEAARSTSNIMAPSACSVSYMSPIDVSLYEYLLAAALYSVVPLFRHNNSYITHDTYVLDQFQIPDLPKDK